MSGICCVTFPVFLADPKLLLIRPKIMILYVSKVTKVTKKYNFMLLRLPKKVIKWFSMVHVGAKWYKVVHVGTNYLKEKHWQISGKLVALT